MNPFMKKLGFYGKNYPSGVNILVKKKNIKVKEMNDWFDYSIIFIVHFTI
jgi:hypothetical protein